MLAGLLVAGGEALAHPHVWVTMRSKIVYGPDGSMVAIRHAWTFDDMYSAFAIQGLDDPQPSKKDAPARAADSKPAPQPQPEAQSGGVWGWLTWAWNLLTAPRAARPAMEQRPSTEPEIVQAPPAQLKPPEKPDPTRVLTRQQLQPLAEVNVTSLKEYDFFTFAKADGKKATFVTPTEYHLEYKDAALTLYFLLPFEKPVKAKRFDMEVYDPSYFVDFSFAEKDAAALEDAPPSCQLAVRGPPVASQPNVQRLPDELANQPDTMNFGAQFANKIAVKCE